MVKFKLKNGQNLFLKEDQVKKIKGSRLTTVDGKEYEILMSDEEIQKLLVDIPKVEETKENEDGSGVKKKESEVSSLEEAEKWFGERETSLTCKKGDEVLKVRSLKAAREFYAL